MNFRPALMVQMRISPSVNRPRASSATVDGLLRTAPNRVPESLSSGAMPTDHSLLPPSGRRSTRSRARRGAYTQWQKKMLIDASHPEETRVVVVRGSRIEEFDFESGAQETDTRQYLPGKSDARRAVSPGSLCRLRRQSPRFPRFLRNPSGLLPDPLADRQALLQAEAEDAVNDPDFESADDAEVVPAKAKSRGEGQAGRNRRRRRRDQGHQVASASQPPRQEDR